MGTFNSALFNAPLFGGAAASSASSAGTVTAGKLIYGALRLLKVMRPGQTPNVSALGDGLDALNDMVDSWNTDRFAIFNDARATYPLAAGKLSYAWGPGAADISASRPSTLEHAGVMIAGSPPAERALEIMTFDDYAAISAKTLQSTIPTRVYLDTGTPTAALFLWPVPSVAVTVALYAWQQLTAFADLATAYAFPPGYALALRFNLAVQMAPMFDGYVEKMRGNILLESLEAKAGEYLGMIKNLNLPSPVMRCDPAMLGGNRSGGRAFNYLIGS